MDFKWLFLGLSIALASCAGIKDSAENAADNAVNIWQGKQTLTVMFQTHRPYCGGAAPTDDMMKGYYEVIPNQVFYLYKDERPSSIKDMIRLTTDENGKFSIDLKDGTYSIIHADKALSLEEFIKKKKVEGMYYEYRDDACFDAWRLTPDYTVEVKHPMEVTATIEHTCFTGDNPCMDYTGPYPP